MVQFSNVQVLPNPPVDIKLIWTLSGDEPLSPYTISVYEGESQATGLENYVCVASGINVSTNYFIDTVENFYFLNRNHFYYLVATDGLGDTYNSGIIDTTSYLSDYAAAEIIRRQHIAMYNPRYNKASWVVLLLKTEGDRCPTCWDPETGRTTLSNCPTCYNIGFTGGVYTPIMIKGMVNLAPKRNQINIFGTWTDGDGILTMLNFPWMKQNDVLVNGFGERWRVVTVQRVEKGRILISQTLQIRQVKNDDPIFNIDVRSYFEL